MESEQHKYGKKQSLDDMAILNVFIKTIFEPQSPFNSIEREIHEVLRRSEQRLTMASIADLGEHLKDLSTDRIKGAVQGVKQKLAPVQALR